MARVFVTGAGGFIGRAAVQVLLGRGHRVTALVHRAEPPPGIEPVRGDLLAPDSYRQAVAASDAVVHLAAATGRADAATHARVNAEGTRLLAGVCAETRRRLLFVSSVAAQYPDHSHYPYAAAKAAAEAAVRGSGAPCVIARPTIVTGPGSPVIGGLARLATLPVVPVFGDGRTRVQPVDVDDVAMVLADILEQGGFGAETIGIGGPEVLGIEALMLAIRHASGRAGGTVLHLPMSVMLPVLVAGERLTGGRLPLTAGQLSLFRYDGTVQPHPITDARRPSMRSLADTLRRSVAA
jgi:nucleoside-diphosphate-sugar epimerase